MVNKFGLFLVFVLFFVSFVSAVPVYKQNELVDFKVNCVNGGGHCSAGAVCNLTILDNNDDVLLDSVGMTNSLTYFNYSYNVTEVGLFKQSVFCVDGDNGYVVSSFKVTPSGVESSVSDAIIYVVLLFLSLVLLLVCMVGAFKTDSSNEYDFGGKLLKITYGKYIKMGLFFGSYLFLWLLTFFAWQVSDKFLMFDFMGGIFRVLFIILSVLLPPLFLAFVVLALLKWTADLQLWKLAERNLPSRGGR